MNKYYFQVVDHTLEITNIYKVEEKNFELAKEKFINCFLPFTADVEWDTLLAICETLDMEVIPINLSNAIELK